MTSDPPPQQRGFDNGETPRKKRGVPEGLWIQCESCKSTVYRKQVEQNLYLCPDCGHHFIVPGRVRIQQLLDEDSFEEWFDNLTMTRGNFSLVASSTDRVSISPTTDPMLPMMNEESVKAKTRGRPRI